MKTLIIDNYDSFTYNLVDLIGDINQEPPVVVRNDEVEWRDLAERGFDNVVISPGPGRPDRAADFGVSRDAIEQAALPLLGVCLGFQGIAMSAGAMLTHAPALVHGSASRVRHSGNLLFAGVPETFAAGRYHSFVIQTPLPNVLEEIAWTDDGLLMAIARHDRPQWGVQFHPESILTGHGRRILQNFRDLTLRQRRPALVAEALHRTKPKISERRRAFWREVPQTIDADAVFTALHANASHAFWLDSSLVTDGLSQWSYFGDASGPNASVISYRCAEAAVSIQTSDGQRTEPGTIFAYLKEKALELPQTSPPCPFAGGYVGWFGYELQQDCGSHVIRNAQTPDVLLIHADRFVAIDHTQRKGYVCAVDDIDQQQRAERWIEETLLEIARRGAETIEPATGKMEPPLTFVMAQGQSEYIASVESCLKAITEGESYQVCLTNELTCDAEIDPLSVYRVMRKINPAPFAAFLKWPGGAVLSASPERFLSADTRGHVETKPIKGTIRRDPDAARDQALIETLRNSAKDQAENAMIVDLLRNDLSRCCATGTVKVARLFDVETYETVHQLVSTVVGELRPDLTFVDLLQAAFPGGSMTGAPKLRTMEIIDSLERRPRGIYSGALGWIGDDGTADLSIVIRSIIATGSRFHIGVGGGVVAASLPQAEYDEMLLKAKASIRTLVTAAFGRFDEDLYRLVPAERAS
ncbi:MAG: aminodeoxychorismate synthase component I [Xanthobacteraceae bacterium]|nr:aminodeoxychorismate synthase component I [Xanthobacteraceae bacterium]